MGIPEGNVVYDDIENYNGTRQYAYCQRAAIGFLDGWISGIRAAGYKAGVYESGSNAADTLAAEPDDVWIAASKATIWDVNGAGYSLSDTVFTDNQRMRQYSENILQSWGGTVKYQIDQDLVDAPVAGGGGTKPVPTFNSVAFNVPGALATIPTAIADPDIGNGETIGPIVGFYELPVYVNANPPFYTAQPGGGFVYKDGSVTPFNCGQAATGETYPQGINDLGDIVGYYNVTPDTDCLYTPDETCYPYAFKSAVGSPGSCTEAGSEEVYEGINDAGWIMGGTILGGNQFVDEPQQEVPLFDLRLGINGFGQIVTFDDGVYEDASPMPGGSTAYPANTWGTGINNNENVAGLYFQSTQHSSSYTPVFFDDFTVPVSLGVPFGETTLPGTLSGGALGGNYWGAEVNDYLQLPGCTAYDPGNSGDIGCNGFVLLPKN
ncbi:MAG: glycoside hydrolase domain-containing protein [Candidatus Binataceae bacterium]